MENEKGKEIALNCNVITDDEKGRERTAPDGGPRAWLIMLASFFSSGVLFGVINSYSVFQTKISNYLEISQNDTAAASKAALVGSLAMGTTFIVSPISGMLTDCIGIRRTTFIGGALSSGGMLLSSFFAYNVDVLYLTYGIMYGLGGALTYTPSLAILGHYFDKRVGLANGIVSAGSSVFTMFMPHLLRWLLVNYDLPWTLRVLAALSAIILPCSFLFKPLNKKPKKTKSEWKKVLDVSIWKNKKYLVWITFVPFSLIGYFVPYVHVDKFVEKYYPPGSDGQFVIVCLSITSLLGRLIFGYIGDHKKVDRIFLQQLSIFSMGVLTMLFPATIQSYGSLLAVALCMGFFDGCFISLLGSIAIDICGPKSGAQAIGCLLGFCSIPLMIGPYIAGVFFDNTKSYILAFVLAGVPGIIGSIGLFLIRYVDAPKVEEDLTQEPLQRFEKNLIEAKNLINSKEELNGHCRITEP
ncbi:monocarboxylate transporter 10 [Agrilus planipennis]|uniref:Monocarboxylate transporter 10 n=1 Tax=Agrilus planipennis TaxID=224129 RepID=A0A1W4X9N9_AGRPL|nr:monocarboxylate transporter 10 [Agrilus planipennis]